MKKLNNKYIKSFYSSKKTVKSYDKNRFTGFGGRYVDRVETGIIKGLVLETLDKGKTKIIDLGAGKGRLTKQLKKCGFDVIALDASTEMLDILSKFLPKNKILHQSVFQQFDTDERFDAITSLRFFEHFKINDQAKILANCTKVLKKNGYLVYASVGKPSIESSISGLFSYGKFNYFYSTRELQKLFSKSGLRVVKSKFAFIFPRGIFLRLGRDKRVFEIVRKIDKFLFRFLKPLASYRVYVLKKK